MEKEIVKDYINGLNTKKLEAKYHTSHRKVKSILLENGIDIHDPNRNVGPRHKMPNGYWNIKENNEKAAGECRNRKEFSKKHSVAYNIAKENGWITEYDEKYFSSDIKYYGFDDPIHFVYAYEFSDSSVYVGRTMDLKRRDLCHRNKTQNDSVYKFSIEHNLVIPDVKILESGLTATESQELEDKWKNNYETNGWNLINKAKTGLNTGSLGASPRKWTYETCREAAEACKNREDFKKKFSRAHNISRKNGWIEAFFPTKSKRDNGCFETLEDCAKEAEKFSSIMDIRKNYPFLYHKISKNKWTNNIKSLMGWK